MAHHGQKVHKQWLGIYPRTSRKGKRRDDLPACQKLQQSVFDYGLRSCRINPELTAKCAHFRSMWKRFVLNPLFVTQVPFSNLADYGSHTIDLFCQRAEVFFSLSFSLSPLHRGDSPTFFEF